MNKCKKIFSITVCLVGISGCAQHQYVPTQSEINKNNSINTVNAAQVNLKTCQDGVRGSGQNPKTLAAIEIVDKQVIYANADSPNKLELMSSTAKINDKQKNALLESISAFQKCREGIKSDLRSFQTLAVTYENFYGEMDIVYAQLISKKITIGDANTQKSQLALKAKTAYTTATSNLDNQYNSAINQEQQARQAEEMQRRALATQYLMNQQAISAQQQINQQNQINNNRPVNTNCYKIGNSVNCTTQ